MKNHLQKRELDARNHANRYKQLVQDQLNSGDDFIVDRDSTVSGIELEGKVDSPESERPDSARSDFSFSDCGIGSPRDSDHEFYMVSE